ncbi:hypothetical protein GQ457_08G025530 [Hibiscus cannabinus]
MNKVSSSRAKIDIDMIDKLSGLRSLSYESFGEAEGCVRVDHLLMRRRYFTRLCKPNNMCVCIRFEKLRMSEQIFISYARSPDDQVHLVVLENHVC